jgi:ClpP class serine protease
MGKICDLTGRNTIVYYSGWMKNNNQETQINETDKNAFMNAVYQMDRTKGLNLILHTPGGDIAATESIVEYLQSLFKGNIHAIVPQISMSAGTMMAISCKDIMMGRQSSLGPIDPQIGGIACQMVVSEFYQAAEEIKEEPSKLGLWREIIGKYPVAFMTTCTDAIKWSEELAEKWLKNVNSGIDIKNFKNTFINHTHSYSHSRRISREECRRVGLQIVDLENSQDLQEAVLSMHHCLMILMDIAPVLKLVSNQEGRLYIQTKSKEPTK